MPTAFIAPLATFCRRLSRGAAATALGLLSGAAMAQPPQIDRVVTFGASLSDTGNSFVWLSQPANRGCGTSLNVPPYASLDEYSVPDGPYATGGHHYTNGATWVEGLTRYLALAGNARPAFANAGQKASNYAVGGARAVAGYPCRYNLPAQVSAYLADFPQTSPRTWVAVEIGGNDVRDAVVAALTGYDPAPYLQNALYSLGGSLTTLHAHGARRFLLLNVPDVGKTPAVRALGPVAMAVASNLASQYNAGLLALRQQLGLVLPGSDVRILDINATLNQIVNHPATYGFANVTAACVTPNLPPFKCNAADGYVFWDGIHPTKAVHDLVAQQAITLITAP